MNLEFKESLFRYIFPACLFWSPILIIEFSTPFNYRNAFVSGFLDNLSVFLVILLGSGIIISALGGLCVKIVDWWSKPRWYNANTEIDHWRDISKEEEFTRIKIDRRWNFYVTNLNSSLSVLSSLVIISVFYSVHMPLVIMLGGVFIIFVILAVVGYYSMKNFDKKLNKNSLYEN